MGRQSLLDKSRTAANEARAAYYYGEVATAATKLLLREGLYLSIMADLMLVTGHVRKDSVFGGQRAAMIELVKSVQVIANVSIPLVNWQPFGWCAKLLEGFRSELEGEETDDDGEAYYKSVDLYIRLLMAVMLPALLRMSIETLKGTVEISSLV